MKKVLLIVFALVLFSFMTKVNAGPSISITETNYTNGRISIEGTGIGEIQIVLFGLDNLPLYMTTVTAEDGEFSIILPPISGLDEGTYNIKISDYEGVNTSTGTVEITAEANPQTSDNVITYIILGFISFVGIIVLSTFIYKSSANKQKTITKKVDA